MTYALTLISRNSKTGPIPVSTSTAKTCPDACPLKKAGCYADGGPLAIVWRKVTEGLGLSWDEFAGKVKALPKGALWRHNQAGDLAGHADTIDGDMLHQLVAANRGKRGFTYTHKPMTPGNAESVKHANTSGFTINLSANNPAHADRLADMGIAPVVTILPADQLTAMQTPSGRKIAICPAVLSDRVNCANCGLCQNVNRKAIIGFPAHGASKRKASAIAAA
jgi:hypothetical protein